MRKDNIGIQLLSIHNIHFLIQNLRELRQAIIDETVETFASQFFENYFKYDKEGVPQWIRDALKHCMS